MTRPTDTVTIPLLSRTQALALSAVCWAAFAAILWLIGRGDLAGFDRAGLLLWRGVDLAPRGPAWLLEGVRDLTALGGVLLRNLIGVGALVALLFIGRRREAIVLAVTAISGWLVDDAIKHAIDRPRPTIVPHLTQAGGASFPSGHSFNAALIYLTMALTFAAMSGRASVRRTTVGTAIVISMAIAWTRVWLGVHWPSDTVAGLCGGAGWALLAAGVSSARPAAVRSDPTPR